MTTVNPAAMLRLMNSTPEQLAAQLILRRCDAALEELSAIASVELSDVLAAIHNGDTLTPDQQSRLASYLSAELSTCGMLSLEQLRSGGMPETAATIRRQARFLLSLVQS